MPTWPFRARRLCLILLSWMALASQTAAAAGMLWGVNGHPITAYPGIAISDQLNYLEDLGATSYRVNISYLKEADKLATLVSEAKKRGIDILPVLTPSLDLDALSPEALYARSRAFALALGNRFKGDIRIWELGNELENYAIIKACERRDDGTIYPCDWGPAGGTTALQYYGPRWAKSSAVLRGLSDGMIEADPTIRKAMGTAGWGHTGAFERMKADRIQWDISVWHLYGQDPEWAFQELARYGKPIWVTEINHPKGSQLGELEQAKGLANSMARLKQLQQTYKVEAAHVYELLDETYWAPDFEAYMGLVGLAGSNEKGWTISKPKPSYEAVREAIRGPRTAPQRDCNLTDIGNMKAGAQRTASLGYCLVLGRSVGAEETQGWVNSLEDGRAPNDMLAAMLASDEFQRRYATFAMSDRVYVAFLYRLLLGREADGAGLDGYAGQLGAGTATRASIASALVQSAEFAGRYKLQ